MFTLPVLLGACTPGTPPSQPEPSADPQPTATTSEEDNPTDPTPEATPIQKDGPPEEPAPQLQTKSGQELCEALCKKVGENCKQDNVKFCLASCPDYQEASERCPLEVEEALSCQMNSEAFLLCSGVANEQCAPFYQAMNDCREGRAEPKTTRQEEASGLPSGWHRVKLPSLGGSYALPEGDVEKDGPARIVRRADQAFRIEPLASVPDQYTDKTILRLGTAFVGRDCEKKLRLHGRYETGSVIHVRFSTLCETPAGPLPWEGIFHLSPGRGVAASVKASETREIPEDADLFYFGFEPSGG